MNRAIIRSLGNVSILLLFLAVVGRGDSVAAQENAAEEPFVVEYYYKAKWGFFEEFYDLYRKNHYPVLVRLKDLGRISSMNAVIPVNHAGEADRWDMRFTIVYPNAAIAHENFDTSSIVEELYPDQELFRKEEQRRFEILLEHTDVPVRVDDLSEWSVE